MASDRAKLVLDEQSFQGLLAAAFTIQEHNARMNSGNAVDVETEAAARPNADPPRVETNASEVRENQPQIGASSLSSCKQCGGALPTADATCPNCSVPNFRPGERLQRNWASLWQMSKEQGLALDTRRKPGDDLPLSPADPARVRRDAVNPSAVGSAVAPAESTRSLRIEEVNEIVGAGEAAGLTQDDLDRDHPQELLLAKIDLPEVATSGEEPAVLDGSADSAAVYHNSLNHKGLDQDGLDRDGVSEEEWTESDAIADSSGDSESSDGGWKKLRLKLQFRRADVFLGLAVIVALVALLWPAAGQQKSGPTLWERTLIAMGVAEEPQQTVNFHGDPDLKVWVDTHTALYYCPGDELYGKSPGGHYTTQREAQADRFEPAERSVCIQ